MLHSRNLTHCTMNQIWNTVIVLFLPLCCISYVLRCEIPTHRRLYRSGQNDVDDSTNKQKMLRYLEDFNEKYQDMNHRMNEANWNYETDLTEPNKKASAEATKMLQEFEAQFSQKTKDFHWEEEFKLKNRTIYRQFEKISKKNKRQLSKEKQEELLSLELSMKSLYSKAKVTPLKGRRRLPLDPDLTKIMSSSRNYDELLHTWKSWRDETGKKMRNKYVKFIKLKKEYGKLNNMSDYSKMLVEPYEMEDFQDEAKRVLIEIEPLYKQLHAYVRKKLTEYYGPERMSSDGRIPAHLLGNMWSQDWDNIMDIVKPYPNVKNIDITEEMERKKMKPKDLFLRAENFFASLGFQKMTPIFWERSVITRPKNREMVCHASAWDIYKRDDFRIKMCTEVNMEHLITVHHEMGHIQYYMEYAHQPTVFRDGANPGFHEAVGDTLSLSASTPQYLKSLGFLKDLEDNYETEITYLLKKALQKVTMAPFALIMDLWRWNIYSGKIPMDKLNEKWWELRSGIQGLCPAVERTERDLDPAAKYHIASNSDYIQYFVALVHQFQFHKSLCEEAGHEGPLHKCNIYKNEKAGILFRKMLALGSSVSWKEALKVITRGKSTKLDIKPMMEYFTPLMKWLKKQNKNENIGWNTKGSDICSKDVKNPTENESSYKKDSSKYEDVNNFRMFVKRDAEETSTGATSPEENDQEEISPEETSTGETSPEETSTGATSPEENDQEEISPAETSTGEISAGVTSPEENDQEEITAGETSIDSPGMRPIQKLSLNQCQSCLDRETSAGAISPGGNGQQEISPQETPADEFLYFRVHMKESSGEEIPQTNSNKEFSAAASFNKISSSDELYSEESEEDDAIYLRVQN